MKVVYIIFAVKKTEEKAQKFTFRQWPWKGEEV